MNYVVVTNEWLSEHGIMPLSTMRKTKDGSKILMHEDYLTPYLQKEESDEENEDTEDKFPLERYPHNSKALNELLASDEWSYQEGEAPDESSDFTQVAAIRNLMKATMAGIQAMSLTDNEALQVKDMYPEFEECIGQELPTGFKLNYSGKLYKVIQKHTAQEGWKPSELLALYGLVTESHAGTLEDPIPYEHMMVLEKGKYYTQNGVTYLCKKDSVIGYDADLTDLLSLLEVVE